MRHLPSRETSESSSLGSEHDMTAFLNEMKINELLAVAHPTAG